MFCKCFTLKHTTQLSFDVSFLENPCGYPRKLYIARNYSPYIVQGHPRSLILAPIERAYATSDNNNNNYSGFLGPAFRVLKNLRPN